MQKVRVPVTNFSYGEVSPSLYSRTDSAVYTGSAQRIENFFLRAEGGVIKRAGLRAVYRNDVVINTAKTQQSRLLPFIFSDDERYVVSLEHQKIKFFFIDPITGVLDIVTTLTQDINSNALKFTDTFLHEYTFAQAGDVMFICHPTFMPQQIVRTALNLFQIEPFVFDARSDLTKIYQPYYNFHRQGTTLGVSDVTGNGVTLTTSDPYFATNGDHDGITLRYHGAEIEITSVQSTTQATGNIFDTLTVRLAINSFSTTEGQADIEVTMVKHGFSVNDAVTVSHSGSVGGISNNQINGSRTVAEIIDNDKFVITAGANANASAIGGGTPKFTTKAPTTSWEEQSYSALRGFPGAVTFHQNRLVFGGTLSQPDSMWFSKSGEYYNFDVGTAKDDESIHVTASVGEINQIRHLVSNRDLQVFTATSEMYVPAFSNQPITPTNIIVRRQTPFGCDFVRPQALDGATLFVQKGGAIVREYVYADSEAAYVANPISLISSHLIKTPIEMNTMYGAMSRSESYVFVTNYNGTISVFNSNRGEDRAGWTEFTTQGFFNSTVTIDDRVFASVIYDQGDNVEVFAICEFDEAYNTDVSSIYIGTNGVFDVSDFYENGAVLNVIDGNNYVGEFTVAGGNIDVSAIDPTLARAEIGLKFDVTLTTNPLDIATGSGPVTGTPRRIGSVVVDLHDTLSATVNGANLVLRNVTDDLSLQVNAFTGKKEFRLMGYSRDPQITVTQSAPLALQVNGIVAELTF
tara:strand:+ start:8328 stop:10565 length:2238 start_codon:yes stop_codon:yes gene_type:complete